MVLDEFKDSLWYLAALGFLVGLFGFLVGLVATLVGVDVMITIARWIFAVGFIPMFCSIAILMLLRMARK